MKISELFFNHIEILKKSAESIMTELGVEGLVYSAGPEVYYFQDDQTSAFRPFHHFAHWCPRAGAEHVVVITPGNKPILLNYAPQDFWYDHTPLASDYWTDLFEIRDLPKVDDIWKEVQAFSNHVHLGPHKDRAEKAGLKTAPEGLEPRLNWARGIKTDYEVFCLDKATEIASKGHFAARDAFLEGGSELDVHLAYLGACRQTDHKIPYNGIVALNEKGAILHYAEKRDDVKNGDVLLIDSGATFKGYGSDITRTYTARNAPAEFKSLLAAMNDNQLRLCESVRVGGTFGDLHNSSHEMLAEILIDHDLVRGLSKDQLIDEEVTRAFYPHGIGHMLGIFVHDVGGRQLDPQGTEPKPHPRYKTLRSLRTIEPGFVFTIEPGLYFIDFLLKPFRTGNFSKHFNWELVDKLMPFGGIRIEDNIAVTNEGLRNLTRAYLP